MIAPVNRLSSREPCDGRVNRGGTPRLGPVVALLLACWSCASIPRESIDLSRQVGDGIGKSRRAHLATLDAFYARLRADNDAWVVSVFLPRTLENAKSALAEACKKSGDTSTGCAQLTEREVERIVKRIVQFRDELQAALDKNHDEAVRLLNEHYGALEAANAGITGLLASAVDVKDAARSATTSLGDVAGVELDLDAIERALVAHLEKAGTVGGSISDLATVLSGVLEKAKSQRPEAAKRGETK